MDAYEQWIRLNKSINVKHYIGPNSHKCINDALAPQKVASIAIKEKPKNIPSKSKKIGNL